MAKAAAAAVTGDISLHESPAFKVSAGVREEGAGEARQVGEGSKARLQEETSSQESARVLI